MNDFRINFVPVIILCNVAASYNGLSLYIFVLKACQREEFKFLLLSSSTSVDIIANIGLAKNPCGFATNKIKVQKKK